MKGRFNLLIALRGWQIAPYHFFLSCKFIKEYRGAFKWGIAASQTLLVCIRILAGTAVPLFFCLSRGIECSCGSFLNVYLWVSRVERREKGKISTLFVPFFSFAGWVFCCSFSMWWSWHDSSCCIFWKRAHSIFFAILILPGQSKWFCGFCWHCLLCQTGVCCRGAAWVCGREARRVGSWSWLLPEKKVVRCRVWYEFGTDQTANNLADAAMYFWVLAYFIWITKWPDHIEIIACIELKSQHWPK